MLSQNKTTKETLQTKEKELDLWIEEYNKQLAEKSIEGKDSEEEGFEERSIEPSLIDRNTIREMLHSAEDWNAIRQEKDEMEKAVASTTALYQSAEKVHQQHLEHQPAQTRDALLAIQQEYQERSQRNELIAANARMQNHQEAVKQLGDKAEALKLVTQEKDDWTAITDAIGADGKTLRKIAQCYTLSFLLGAIPCLKGFLVSLLLTLLLRDEVGGKCFFSRNLQYLSIHFVIFYENNANLRLISQKSSIFAKNGNCS